MAYHSVQTFFFRIMMYKKVGRLIKKIRPNDIDPKISWTTRFEPIKWLKVGKELTKWRALNKDYAQKQDS